MNEQKIDEITQWILKGDHDLGIAKLIYHQLSTEK